MLACVLAVASPAFAAAQDAPGADLAAQITECDILAAHPADLKRMADGVADGEIIPELAVGACQTAVEDDDAPRLRFQLGRSLLAAGLDREAAAEFERAATAGHAGASAYLGDAYQYGTGVAVDLAKALDHYREARTGGFHPAEAFIEQMTFVPSNYTTDLLTSLYTGDFAKLKGLASADATKWPSRAYVFSLALRLAEECDAAVKPARMVGLYKMRFAAFPAEGFAGEADVDIYAALGTHDGDAFLERHGCDGGIARHIFGSLDTFIAQVGG